MRARELAFAQQEEEKRLAREEEESRKLAEMIDAYNQTSHARIKENAYKCETERDAFLNCVAENPKEPSACAAHIAAFAKCSKSLT